MACQILMEISVFQGWGSAITGATRVWLVLPVAGTERNSVRLFLPISKYDICTNLSSQHKPIRPSCRIFLSAAFWYLQATALGFVRYSLDIPSIEIAHEIRTKGHVLVAAGSHFGIEYHLRITHGVDAATFEEASSAILQVLGLVFLITHGHAFSTPFSKSMLCLELQATPRDIEKTGFSLTWLWMSINAYCSSQQCNKYCAWKACYGGSLPCRWSEE